jgi:hypothetical protein
MADPSRSCGSGEGVDPDRRSRPDDEQPRAPRWVKVSAIMVGVLLLVAVIVKLTGLGGNGHGPARHTGASISVPVSVSAVEPPSGGKLSEIQVWTVSYR